MPPAVATVQGHTGWFYPYVLPLMTSNPAVLFVGSHYPFTVLTNAGGEFARM